MDRMNEEELETWLAEVELASEKIKKLANNQMTPEEFDQLELRRQAERERVERGKQEIKRKEEERLRMGWKGKGIKGFVCFCRHCHWEYGVFHEECLRCRRPTQNPEAREAELKVMVEQYKKRKLEHSDRKHKWNMWKKTEAMLWKKTSTHYTKWQNFTSSEDEKEPEQEPILPRHDPNFLALQADFEERRVKREKERAKAEQLKEKGNRAMREGDYKLASEHQTLALEHLRDIKSIYTNRALAYIKLRKFKKAEEDCTRVVDYIECFEKGFTESPDLAFKALARRALARKELNRLDAAAADIRQALLLFPTDLSAIQLSAQIKSRAEHEESNRQLVERERNEQGKERSQQEEQAEGEEKAEGRESEEKAIVRQLAQEQLLAQSEAEVQAGAERLPQNKLQYLRQTMKMEELTPEVQSVLLRIFEADSGFKKGFVSIGAMKKLFGLLREGRPVGLLVCALMEGTGVAEEEFVKQGPDCLLQSLEQRLNARQFDLAEQEVEVLVKSTLADKPRSLLMGSSAALPFVERSLAAALACFKACPEIISSYITLLGNLLYGNSPLKKLLGPKTALLFESFAIWLEHQSESARFVDLRKSCYSALTNLLTEPGSRQLFASHRLCEVLVTRTATTPISEKYYENVEGVLGVWSNLLLGGDKPVIAKLSQSILSYSLLYKYAQSKDLLEKPALAKSLELAFLALSRLGPFPQLLRDYSFFVRFLDKSHIASGLTSHAIRILVTVVSEGKSVPIEAALPLLDVPDNEVVFCNGCTLIGLIAEKEPAQARKAGGRVAPLLEQVRLRVGNVRRSAALLLGKLCKEEPNKGLLREQHGFEVLQSVLQYVVPK